MLVLVRFIPYSPGVGVLFGEGNGKGRSPDWITPLLCTVSFLSGVSTFFYPCIFYATFPNSVYDANVGLIQLLFYFLVWFI